MKREVDHWIVLYNQKEWLSLPETQQKVLASASKIRFLPESKEERSKESERVHEK